MLESSLRKFVEGKSKTKNFKNEKTAEDFDQALIDQGLKRGTDYAVTWPNPEHGVLAKYTFRRL